MAVVIRGILAFLRAIGSNVHPGVEKERPEEKKKDIGDTNGDKDSTHR